MMKKTITVLSAAVMLLLTVPMTAFAHGHSRTVNSTQTARYSVCAVEDCIEAGVHYHDSIAYTSHFYDDGHEYHGYCGIAGCTIAGYHEHDGVYCFGHAGSSRYGRHQSSHRSGGHH